jgi:citronellol/citronellal dehydrogenase
MIMSGGSRGIGLAIAVAAGWLGANVVLLAKTDKPDPRLPGTIHTAAAEIEQAGGTALAVVGDVRDEASVQDAVDRAVDRFGGIDICVNNASALALQHTQDLLGGDVLREAGVTDFTRYGGGDDLTYDIYVDPPAAR